MCLGLSQCAQHVIAPWLLRMIHAAREQLHAFTYQAYPACLPACSVWCLESGSCLHELTGHSTAVASLALNKEGSQLLSAAGITLRRVVLHAPCAMRHDQCCEGRPRDVRVDESPADCMRACVHACLSSPHARCAFMRHLAAGRSATVQCSAVEWSTAFLAASPRPPLSLCPPGTPSGKTHDRVPCLCGCVRACAQAVVHGDGRVQLADGAPAGGPLEAPARGRPQRRRQDAAGGDRMRADVVRLHACMHAGVHACRYGHAYRAICTLIMQSKQSACVGRVRAGPG